MLAVIIFIFGLVIGSFLNVVILRLKAQESLTGRSHCPHCRHQLAWYHNIPLLSFAMLRGRCAFCHTPISWQYPLVELATATVFALGMCRTLLVGDWARFLLYCVVSAFLIALFVFDYKFMLLPDSLTLPAATVALVGNWWLGVSLISLIIGMVVGAGFFALQYYLSNKKWVGSGDIRLGLLMGAVLGWPLLLVALILAYWGGALVGLVGMLCKRYKWHTQLPFGTFLTATTFGTMLWGGVLLNWYLRLIHW